ncbi:MAG: hypothetical protein JO036_05925 [Candidatus Eremiobacteraeota bacterium]|nr:hypothetical protein [Candidatus Eremiobacteraeota bacterium]
MTIMLVTRVGVSVALGVALYAPSPGFARPGEGVTDALSVRATGAFTRYVLPRDPDDPFDRPDALTIGNDGVVWVSEETTSPPSSVDRSTYWIARLDRSGTLKHFHVRGNIPPSPPGWPTSGPDGALWFTAGAGVQRMSTNGVFTAFPFPARRFFGGRPVSGPDGALWFTAEADGAQGIGRVTTSGAFTFYRARTPCRLGSLASGPDGALWFTESFCDSPMEVSARVGRMTTSGAFREYRPPRLAGLNGWDLGIAVGSDGALWLAGDGAAVYRFALSGVVTAYRIPSGYSPKEIVAGSDGALWFTESYTVGHALRSRLGRISTSGVITEFSVASDRGIYGLVADRRGGIWFIEGAPINTVVRASIGKLTSKGE